MYSEEGGVGKLMYVPATKTWDSYRGCPHRRCHYPGLSGRAKNIRFNRIGGKDDTA